MSTDGLDAFRARVARDSDLARRLRSIPRERFVPEAVAEARRFGLEVDEADLTAAIDAARRAWAMRWIA